MPDSISDFHDCPCIQSFSLVRKSDRFAQFSLTAGMTVPWLARLFSYSLLMHDAVPEWSAQSAKMICHLIVCSPSEPQ